jgi:hypothetical protein
MRSPFSQPTGRTGEVRRSFISQRTGWAAG